MLESNTVALGEMINKQNLEKWKEKWKIHETLRLQSKAVGVY